MLILVALSKWITRSNCIFFLVVKDFELEKSLFFKVNTLIVIRKKYDKLDAYSKKITDKDSRVLFWIQARISGKSKSSFWKQQQ